MIKVSDISLFDRRVKNQIQGRCHSNEQQEEKESLEPGVPGIPKLKISKLPEKRDDVGGLFLHLARLFVGWITVSRVYACTRWMAQYVL